MEINSYEYWMGQLANRSPNTLETYKCIFQQFLEFIKQSPNELIIAQRRSMNGKGDPREKRVVENKVLDWIHELQKSKSFATTRLSLTVVKSFFSYNLHPLNIGKSALTREDSIGSRIPHREEVVKIADAFMWKYRAAVMFLKDSGLRCSDLVKLTWEDKRDMGDGFWNFKFVTEKCGVTACAFIGSETTRLLDNFKTKTGRIFATDADNLNWVLNKGIKKTGLKGLSVHGLRKYFVAALEHAGVSTPYILAMQGKRTTPYDENRESYLFEAYKKAYNDLSLYAGTQNGEAITAAQSEIAELKAKMESMARSMEFLLDETTITRVDASGRTRKLTLGKIHRREDGTVTPLIIDMDDAVAKAREEKLKRKKKT